MATVTLHPFGTGPARNRAIAPGLTPQTASDSLWERIVTRYWAGWEHYARAYPADVDQLPRFPLPRVAPPTVTIKRPPWIGIR